MLHGDGPSTEIQYRLAWARTYLEGMVITARVYATVDTVRTVHDSDNAEDPSTAGILHQLIDGLEELAWLIKSENRKV